jgi:hypothetical protein
MRTGFETKRRWMAAAAVVAGLAGAMTAIDAVPASADVPDHEIVMETGGSNTNAPRSKTAECPSGKELIGMGARINGGNGNVLLESIVPDLTNESVTVSAHESLAGTTGNWSLRATAVCADAGSVFGRYLVDEEDYDDTDDRAAAFAECDEGDRALGAGFVLDGAPGRLHLMTLLPTEDGALAAGEEDAAGTTASWSVTSIALCAQLFDSQVHWDSSASATNSSTKNEMTVCPTDSNVASGGASVYDESGSAGNLAIYSLSPESYQGTDYALETSIETPPRTTADSTLYSYVVCLDLR